VSSLDSVSKKAAAPARQQAPGYLTVEFQGGAHRGVFRGEKEEARSLSGRHRDSTPGHPKLEKVHTD
jgi:hypothetical protein